MKIHMLGRKIRRSWFGFFRAIRGWFVMRCYWKKKLQKFEKKYVFVVHMRYFGDYRCYSEYRDYVRWKK